MQRLTNRFARLRHTLGRTVFRMEVTFVLLLLIMTAIGRAGDLDARIKLALMETIEMYRAERVIAAMDKADSPPVTGQRASAALPRGQ